MKRPGNQAWMVDRKRGAQMTKKIGMTVLLSAAVLLLSAPSAVHAQKGPEGKEPPALKAASGYSYVACYFGDASNHQWKWGLTPDNSWYSMSGEWKKLSFTKFEVFVTPTSQSDIEAACARSKAYYKINTNFYAAYAAMKSTGYNYMILSNGACLYSKY
jgi:hypothetical protein